MKTLNIQNLIKVSFITCLFFVIGCSEDFLDVTPQGQIIPSEVKDFEQLLIHPNMNVGVQNQILMSDDLFFPDFDEAEAQFTSSAEAYNLRAYQWLDQIYEGEENDLDWRDMYHKIFISNYVIENIDDAELRSKTESDRDRVRGWAHCSRALANFFLVNLYAKHFNPSTAGSDLGIPLVFRADPVQTAPPRASVAEVYDQIFLDLNKALEVLPDLPSEFPLHNYRPSKVSALALKARIHQYRSEWEESKDAAQLALDIIQDNAQVGLIPIDEHAGDKANWPFLHELNQEVLWVEDTPITGAFPSQGTTFISDELLSIIDANDLRLSLFSIDGEQNGYTGKIAYYSTRTTSAPKRVNTPTVADVYLMLAEAHTRLGNLSEAENLLETLRGVRIQGYTHTDSATAEELLQEIIDERRVEHMFTGLRWFDIKRLNLEGHDISIQHQIIREDQISTIELNPGDPRFVIQLPEKILLDFGIPWEQNE